MTLRTKGVRCVTCSGQKCLHVNIYRDEARQNCVVGKRSERQKEKTKTTEVVGEIELPLKPMREDEEEVEDSIPNETNPFLHKGKRANVFNVKIKYPLLLMKKGDQANQY